MFRTREDIMMRVNALCCALLILIVAVHAEVRYIGSALGLFFKGDVQRVYDFTHLIGLYLSVIIAIHN